MFTALAAAAALWTAWQGRRLIETAERPFLEAQVLRDSNGNLMLSIINSGAGVARGVNFAVHAAGRATDNVVGDGFLAAGAGVHIRTDIPLPAPPRQLRADLPDLGVMVAYRDAAGFVHYRTNAGEEYVPKTLIRRRPKFPDRLDVFRRLYPSIDLNSAERASNAIDEREEP